MIRIFSHYFRLQAVLQVLFDLSLILFLLAGFDIVQTRADDRLLPIVATHGLSLAACLLFINTASGLYRPAPGRSLNQSCARGAVALLLALPIAYGIFSLLPADLSQQGNTMTWVAMLAATGVVGHRVYAAHVGTSARSRSRFLIFGSGSAAQLVGRTLRAADPRVQVVGYFPAPNETERVVPANEVLSNESSLRECAIALRVDEIVVAVTERRGGAMPLRDLLDCKVGGIHVSDMSAYFEKMFGQIRIDHVHASWLIFGDGFQQGLYRTIAKRLFDIVCAVTLLLLASPLMLIATLAIVIDSRGPVFYRQERVGRDGRNFSVLKFRSMRVDAEQNGRPQWATSNDQRITRVGSIIRRFRIDELPQLLNVLSGDMSLVGPRPERPFFVEQLTRETPYYAVRHSVKPGVTGWAQVRFQYGATMEDSLEKLQYDLYYVKNHTLLLDIVIMFETIGVVLSGKGAR